MPSTLPDGDPVPADGSLPPTVSARAGRFGIYVHVPFCTTRCGYCDFNTYTASELGPGAGRTTYAASVVGELDLAARVLEPAGAPKVSTVFFGGGTPTLLPTADLVRVLDAIREQFGLDDGAEVTTEANPDSVDARSLDSLRDAGFTRISFGMQSAVPHVLGTLDRTHTPGRVVEAVGWARAAGFEQVSLDLIYGTPGESLADWRHSLNAALALEPDHISAYALILEPGTKLYAQVARGVIRPTDDDAMADAYLLADEVLGQAGLDWYEVSNWARTPQARCRHNLGYWRGDDWWGIGPGAHSHVDGVRWWNVKHPAAYALRIDAGVSPGHAREVLDASQRATERILLEIRLSDGCELGQLSGAARVRAAQLALDGLLDPDRLALGKAVLTVAGRLLADAVVRELVD